MPSTQNQTTRIAAYGLVTDAGRILLCRISGQLPQHAGSWTLPGGGLKFGEDPVSAMVREVQEETGLVVRAAGIAGIDSLVIEGESATFHSIRILYLAQILGGKLADEVDGTTDRCHWHDMADVRSLPAVDLVHRALDLLPATSGVRSVSGTARLPDLPTRETTMANIWSILVLTAAAAGTLAHEPMVVAPGEGRAVPVPFHETTLLLSENDSQAGVSVYEFVVPPRSGGAPPHRHTHEDEFAYVLDGQLTLLLGDETFVAGPGTLAALTRGTVHAFWNATDEPVRTLFFISQGGFEQFFDAVAVSLREQPPSSAEDANARIGAIAAEHGIEIEPELIPEDIRALYAPNAAGEQP